MQTVTLSGWGQSSQALHTIAPHGIALDYAAFPDIDAFYQNIAERALAPDIVIGWSLGGMIALDGIIKDVWSPKLLILIASSLYFAHPDYDEFTLHFQSQPQRVQKMFQALIAKGDKHAPAVLQQLDQLLPCASLHLGYWLHMLRVLDFRKVHYPALPKTVIIQGANDVIMPADAAIKDLFPDVTYHLIPDAGHAPHLSNKESVREFILQATHQAGL